MAKKLLVKKYIYGGSMANTFSTNIMAAPFMGGGQGVPMYSPTQGSQFMPKTMIETYARAGEPTAMMLNMQASTQRTTSALKDMASPDNLMKGFGFAKDMGLFGKKAAGAVGDAIETDVAGDLVKKKGFMNTKGGKIAGFAGQALAGISDAIPSADKVMNSNDELTGNIRSTANKALLSSGNPFAMAAGAVNTIIDKTGGFTDGSEGLGGGTDFLNGAASLLVPGAGWFTKRTEKYKKSEALSNSSSYTGTSAAGDKAMKNAGAKLLFGRGKANEMIRKQRERDNQVQDVLKDAKDDFAGAASANFIAGRNQMDSMGGYQALRVKHGGVIRNMDFIKKCKKKKRKLQEGGSVNPTAMPLDFVERMEVANGTKSNVDSTTKESNKPKDDKSKKYSSSDKLTTTAAFYMKRGGRVNVIPSGKLHKERHRLEKIIEGMEKVSSKGIPVVTTNAVGELKQQAEIERDEIILNKELSRKLLELMDSEDEDEAMIKAGMLLSDEIMENTEDNTGLIKNVKV